MRAPWRIRRIFHDRGNHRFCRVVRVYTHSTAGQEFLVTDKGEKIDITPFGGIPHYKTVHK